MEDVTSRSSGSDLDLKEFLIPDYILNLELEAEKCAQDVPEYPVIVFINSKSGGQLGGDLLQTYRSLLNKYQVVDLLEEAPDKYLSKVYMNLETLKRNGDDLASKIQENLRLIVAGGDGTAGWLLGVVCDLKLPHPPAIATVPLGTGNNLPFAFGWGKRNPGTNEQAVKSFLHQVKMAKEMKIDNWHIVMRMRTPKEGNNCEPVAPLELPHALHSFQRVTSTDSSQMEDGQTFRGGFWNYFSMGMDAQVSYAFHAERKLHPEKFKNQLVNQSMYAKLGCTQGWFLGSLLHPADKNIAQLAKVMIKKSEGADWEELHVPRSIRSIVCLNLPSFSGGLNPWGKPRKRRFRKQEDFGPLYVDDGLIEVVGFRNAWQGLTLLSSKGHGTRLAQAHKICFKFHKGAAEHTYMRIDGEPWKQPLPVDDDTVEVEISPLGQVNMLAIPGCRSKSTGDPESVHSSGSMNGDDDDDEDDEGSSHGDEWSKFGAADTFKIPENIDISRFS